MQLVKPVFGSYFLSKAVFAILFVAIASISFAQDKENELVKVKIVRIVDGDTTTFEKTMDEANVQSFTKQFENIQGKNVQVMITVSDVNKTARFSGKNRSSSSMNFNFDMLAGLRDMDSAIASSFSNFFMYNDSSRVRNFIEDDSLGKNFLKDFNFNFNFDEERERDDFDFNINTDDEGENLIIKNKDGKTVIIKGEDKDNSAINKSEKNRKTQTKTIIINDNKTKTKKKVIVSTSVVVMDDEGKSDKKKMKEENSFNFYPNPSDGNFILDLNLNGKEDAFVSISDMNGKEVYNEKVTGNGKTSKAINLNSDKSGTFIVTIKQGKKISTKKLIIE